MTMHPELKLLRAAGIVSEHLACVMAERFSLEEQATLAGLISEKNPMPPPFNGKFVAVPESLPAQRQKSCLPLRRQAKTPPLLPVVQCPSVVDAYGSHAAASSSSAAGVLGRGARRRRG